MTFLWPELLWLLLLVPVLVAVYFALLKRKKRLALRYASLGMVGRAAGVAQSLRRHIPPFVFLIALVTLILAVARPSATLTLPAQYETIVLAIDISGSMRASDVKPNRIGAAQAAARKFIADQPSSARIGLVSFAATASVLQPPTRDREAIFAALDRLQLQRGTAVGSGILVALKTIFPDVEFDLRASNPRGEAKAALLGENSANKSAEKLEPGSFSSAAIILLTDGQTNTGPNPIEAARMAAEHGVKVFTVGIGTTKGETLGAEGWSMRVKLDEDALKDIAQVTHGEYFFADNDVDLKQIYDSLNTRLSLETKQTEITALLAAAAAALSLISAFLSVLWFNRIL